MGVYSIHELRVRESKGKRTFHVFAKVARGGSHMVGSFAGLSSEPASETVLGPGGLATIANARPGVRK